MAARVESEREQALRIAADRRSEHRVLPADGDQGALEQDVADRRHDEDGPVARRRQRGEMRLVHPADDEGHERDPEEQEQIGPQHLAVDACAGVQYMVVVAPEDADIRIAQRVGEEDG